MRRIFLYVGLLSALGAAVATRWLWGRTQRAEEHGRLALLAFNQGRLDDAGTELRRELAIDPGRALPYYKLGVIESRQKRYPEAREALTRAIALGVRQPQADCVLGFVEFQLADYSGAVAPLERCLAHHPEDDQARYLLAESFLGQARHDEAEKILRELIRRHPRNAQIFYVLGTVYLSRPATSANDDAAIAVLRRAIALDNTMPGAFYSLGLVYRRAGRWQEAALALQAAVRRDPKMPEARHALGQIYRRLGKVTEAREQFRIARIQSAAANRDRRISYLRGETQRNPENPMVHVELGRLLEERRERSGAAAEFESALRLNPSLAEARQHLAALHTHDAKPEGEERQRVGAPRQRPEPPPSHESGVP
jgi:tetratricopeptide (TPR) repeat protein